MIHRIFCLAFLVCFVYSAFSPIPLLTPKARRTKICTDYCLSKTQSNAGNFNMQNKGWELCFCQAGTTSEEWQNGGCYQMCINRCVSTFGKCANHVDANNYKGACCTTSAKNNTVNKQCFIGTLPGGIPNGDCYQQV